MSFCGNNSGCVTVPYDDVGIRANSNSALLRVDAENFGRICARDGNVTLRIQESGNDSLFPDDRHAVLDPVDAVWYFCEVTFAEFFLVFVKGAIVATGCL